MPDRVALLNTVRPLCPDVPPDLLQDFFARLDQEYFQRFTPSTIAEHVRLTAQLTPEHLCEVVFAEQPDQRCVITIVAYDYFSEFAMICGLLSAFGLNIEEGDLYIFRKNCSLIRSDKLERVWTAGSSQGHPRLDPEEDR